MPLTNLEQHALAAARLLGQLPGKDLASAGTQEWLCGELARLFDACSAALYWPGEEGAVPELWGTPASHGGPGLQEQSWLEAANKASLSGQVVWVAGDPGSMVCLPFPAEIRARAVLLLWTRTPDYYGMEELLGALGAGIAGQRDQARQLRRSREACAELERRRAELLNSRDTLRALFDNTPTSMYIVGANYTLLAVNRSRAGLAGQKPQRLVGRRCFEALFDRASPCPDCLVGESLAAGRYSRRITKRAHSGDRVAVLEIATFPVQTGSGQVGQAIVFEEDVTERRRLEASLAQSEKLAVVGQLAAGVAHEINNPLTAIIANAQLLQRSLAGQDRDWSEMVDLMLQAGQRAAQVVQQLLDLSRQSRTELLLTDVNDSLRQAFSMVQHQLTARSIRLVPDLAQDLPVLWASPDQLHSVWLNLLVNAIDAVRDGQGEIRVRTRQAGNTVEVLVADNGAGIPAERLAQIFEPFYTTKDPGSGTGLGLSICHRVVKKYGGEIRVESRPGQGTAFTVALPVTQPS